MSEVKRLAAGLRFSSAFAGQMLDEFQNDEDWVSRPHDKANHALWFMEHIGVADNSMIGMLDPLKMDPRSDMKELFGGRSTPSNDLSDYPPPAEVRAWKDDRRQVLLKLVADLSDEDLDRPTPDSAPPFMPDVGTALQFMAWHEGLHAGQITVPHRALGNAPIAGRPAKERTNA